MGIGMRTLGLVAATALLLGGWSGEAFGLTQIYRAKLSCDGEEGQGAAAINTLVKRDSSGFSEPFFRVVVNLSQLPDLPLDSCDVALTCRDGGEMHFDCAGDVKPHSMAFKSDDIFLGALPAHPCHEPAVRVTLGYTGDPRSCSARF